MKLFIQSVYLDYFKAFVYASGLFDRNYTFGKHFLNKYDIYVECHFGENDLNTCVHMYKYSSRYYIHVHAT